jgi:hypothetical protein
MDDGRVACRRTEGGRPQPSWFGGCSSRRAMTSRLSAVGDHGMEEGRAASQVSSVGLLEGIRLGARRGSRDGCRGSPRILSIQPASHLFRLEFRVMRSVDSSSLSKELVVLVSAMRQGPKIELRWQGHPRSGSAATVRRVEGVSLSMRGWRVAWCTGSSSRRIVFVTY